MTGVLLENAHKIEYRTPIIGGLVCFSLPHSKVVSKISIAR